VKILFLTPQLPYPPQKGTALRNWGLISGLAARHEVAVLSFTAPGQDATPKLPPAEPRVRIEAVPQPARTSHDRLRDLLTTPQPDMALRLASEAYAQRLAVCLRQEAFDVIHVEGIELAAYLDVIDEIYPSEAEKESAPRPIVVFDDHNCEYLLQRRAFLTDLRAPARWLGAAYSLVQWRRLCRYEAQVCRRADRVLAVSKADAAALQELAPGLDVTVVPNGIDTQSYKPESPGFGSSVSRGSLVFTGTMDFRPNVDAVLWFVRRVLPRIREEAPEARFVVVGQRPHRRLDGLRDDPAVTLTGWVEDTRPYIAGAAVYVAPLRMGGGTRLKLLEAMAMGKPVVATRLGAEGYPVTHGREMLLADRPAQFAAAVVKLLRQPALRAELGRAGRAFVEQRYDWRAIVPLVEAAYDR